MVATREKSGGAHVDGGDGAKNVTVVPMQMLADVTPKSTPAPIRFSKARTQAPTKELTPMKALTPTRAMTKTKVPDTAIPMLADVMPKAIPAPATTKAPVPAPMNSLTDTDEGTDTSANTCNAG